jgi:hypothetical protein
MTTIPKWTAENTPKAYQDLVTPNSAMFVEADKTDSTTTKDSAAPKTYLLNTGYAITDAAGKVQDERDTTGYIRVQEGTRLVTNLFAVPIMTIFRIVEAFSLYHFWPCNKLNPRKNNEIRAEQVSISNSDGSTLGPLSLSDALKRAQEQELDLVEVSSGATPPVCKIVDYHKYCNDPKNIQSQEYQLLRRVANFAEDIALIALSPLFLVIHEIVALAGVIFPDLTRSAQSWLEETVLKSHFCENMKPYSNTKEMIELAKTFKDRVKDESEKIEEKKDTKETKEEKAIKIESKQKGNEQKSTPVKDPKSTLPNVISSSSSSSSSSLSSSSSASGTSDSTPPAVTTSSSSSSSSSSLSSSSSASGTSDSTPPAVTTSSSSPSSSSSLLSSSSTSGTSGSTPAAVTGSGSSSSSNSSLLSSSSTSGTSGSTPAVVSVSKIPVKKTMSATKTSQNPSKKKKYKKQKVTV